MSKAYTEASNYNGLRRLVGETVIGVYLNVDKTEVMFHTQDGGSLTYATYGDCCSNTWIEHMTVPVDIYKGGTVVGVGQADMPGPSNQDDGEVIQVYQTCWVTNLGEIIIEYRNASNGYYGGWIELKEDH